MHTPLGLESFVSSTITMKIKEYFIYLNTTDHGTWEEKTSSVWTLIAMFATQSLFFLLGVIFVIY